MNNIKSLKNHKKDILLISLFIILINVTLTFIYGFFTPNRKIKDPEVITLFSLLLSGVFVPFFEETLMRGIFQKFLMEKTKFTIPIIYLIVASVFSMLHMEIFFIPYFITSLLLSYVFTKSNYNLLVPIICHMNYNLFVLFLYSLNI
ncbi:CPBP family intramembrane glutamic endopeptidase [Clostridium sporogenes]|uniref:CPBP family intramembrane glutamic endopeptidase n=1 Tax=Clostridium sporogenes TaxID=1509 RepID=UPI000717A13A|nr:CPBP family intramembrane glutamic endopeptidase [Clostridium sporogenes]MBY7065203.1 CPBP family intramembrane metalloprotease [Clostridium sporogenes]MBY7071827.1 CPBP family intramembrane metalloprotease [Clostridium sporogenes]MCW6064727.1 CPBP family intramembrane metalloprotease [Clostridium sporogenes]UCA39407.1 CPBP family intramembrane metalloprotease [Clostridium sporogenes]